MLSALSGYKTYLVAAAIVAYQILGYPLGYTSSIDTNRVLEALGLAALRAGIGKAKP